VVEAREINTDLRALAFLNSADAQGRDNTEAQEALREVAAIEVLDLVVVRRKAFPNAAAQGRGVIEQQPRDPRLSRN
jgi:chromosome partitioning protein